MTDKTIYAWTSVGDYLAYPQYLNVARRNGQVEITVRAPEDTSGEYPVSGPLAKCTIPDEIFAELIVVLWTHLDAALTEMAVARGLLPLADKDAA